MLFNFSYTANVDAQVLHNADETRFIANEASADARFGVSFELEAPIRDSFIMIPACAYDGNRFEAVERRYPPMFSESEMGINPPTRMTQVPRLSPEGDSKMEVTTGDMAVPCVCILNKVSHESFMLFTEQGAHGLNFGITLEQKGTRLIITIGAPSKRSLVYHFYDGYPSLRENPDADADMPVSKGTETVIRHLVFTEKCDDIPSLYRSFFDKRSVLYKAGAQANLSFSRFMEMAEAEMNLCHFEKNEKFYTLDALDERHLSKYAQWQPGWVGGGMATYPLICLGSDLSVERSINTLSFAARYQSRAGWFYGVVYNGKAFHDCFEHYGDKYNLVLVRKQADLVYFMFKQIEVLRRKQIVFPEAILKSAVSGADALVKLWQKYGQLGQFIDTETGEIIVGNSTSGAMAPAALCAAYAVTGNDSYLTAAGMIADYYHAHATEKGVTTGGPGEILQAPDSESCAALLESYTVLYEQTLQQKWLRYALEAAHQLSSWVVAYDFRFPEDSPFGKLNILTAGSVWANVQNKHSAPGLCTVSPVSLLKLFRATSDKRYLELMQTIAHYMPQSVSYPERPILTNEGVPMHPFEMCERVNLSDWEGRKHVGGNIFGACSWPETSLMLTCLEVPGVYALPERGIVCASDHVNAWLQNGMICIQNPLEYDASVSLMVDTEQSLCIPLGMFRADHFKKVTIPAGQSVRISACEISATVKPYSE